MSCVVQLESSLKTYDSMFSKFHRRRAECSEQCRTFADKQTAKEKCNAGNSDASYPLVVTVDSFATNSPHTALCVNI